MTLGVLSTSYAQDRYTDSLEYALLEHEAENKEKVSLLNNLGYEYWVINPVQSIIYGQQARVLAEILNDSLGLALSNRIVGVAHWARGSYDQGLRYLIEGLRLYQKMGDTLGTGNCLMNIGLIYADRNDYNLAREYYFEALKKFETIDAHLRSATTYSKLATLFIDEGKIASARDFLDRAYETHTNKSFLYGQGEVLNRYGLMYAYLGKYDSAEYYLKKSIAISKQINDVDGLAKSHVELAEIRLAKGDLSSAEPYLQTALDYAQKLQSHKWLKKVYENLRELARRRGNYRQAILYYDQYVQKKDSIFNEQTLNNIAKLEAKLATVEHRRQLDLKESEIEMLEKETQLQQVKMMILLVALIALALLALLITRSRRLAAERKQDEGRKAVEQARQELEFRNRELVSYTVNFAQKNQLFEDLMGMVKSLKEKSGETYKKDLVGMERAINKHIQIDKDWDDFKLRFESVHKGFFDKLLQKQPALTGNDLKLCALVKMNFSIKEVSDMMGISSESVKTARYRLKKKLQLSPEMSINDFLNSID